MKTQESLHFSIHFGKKLRRLQIRPSAVGMASNFGHRSGSRRSQIFGYGRITSAFGPTLQNYKGGKSVLPHGLGLNLLSIKAILLLKIIFQGFLTALDNPGDWCLI